MKFILNDKAVYVSDREKAIPTAMLQRDKVKVNVLLEQGWNKLVVKTVCEEWKVGFFLRFQDAQERPIPGLIFSPDKSRQ